VRKPGALLASEMSRMVSLIVGVFPQDAIFIRKFVIFSAILGLPSAA